MAPVKSFHLHLVSDATGETINSIVRACLVQFEDVAIEEHVWFLIRTQSQIQRVLDAVESDRGIVLFCSGLSAHVPRRDVWLL